MQSDWEKRTQEFRKAEAKAMSRLHARGTRDPREGVKILTAEMYEEIKRYDALLAGEIVSILAKPAVSIPVFPDDSQLRREPHTKRDWASSAYDR